MIGPPHDVPTAAQLVEAVREWLQRDVMPETSGRMQFHARVAVNVLAIVERELALGPQQASAHAARLASLGVASEAELADAEADHPDVRSRLVVTFAVAAVRPRVP